VSWDDAELEAACRGAGAGEVSVEKEQSTDTRRITEHEMELWLAPDSTYGKALAAEFSAAETAQVHAALRSQLVGGETAWTSTVAFVIARN
jgi:hypothetical protein